MQKPELRENYSVRTTKIRPPLVGGIAACLAMQARATVSLVLIDVEASYLHARRLPHRLPLLNAPQHHGCAFNLTGTAYTKSLERPRKNLQTFQAPELLDSDLWELSARGQPKSDRTFDAKTFRAKGPFAIETNAKELCNHAN